MTKTITKTTLLSSADNNVYETINNRSNVADPRNRGTYGKFVYRNDPWSKGLDYQSYPYIILRFPSINQDNKSLDGNDKDVSYSQSITVRTIMAGAINNATGDSKGVTDMQEILDDLLTLFNKKTVKDSLRLKGHHDFDLRIDSNDELVDDNGKHIFITELTLTYNTRIGVGP